ncbi:MAG: FtsW/RodA/SpoVE family cell cycle protein [Oscillospiraceae bacterium]|nr:FtsW/RodA/SpoVE family cell cycle protein [Oscillospiraceae bacterium]
MKKMLRSLRYFFSRADMLLLFLCVIASTFGIVAVASATQHFNSNRYVLVQIAALLIGILLYVVFTLVDIDIIAERRELLFLFNMLFVALLFSPLGINVSGNRSWLHIPGVPFNIQPAEICKITFIVLIAKIMSVHQRTISRPGTVIRLGFHLIFIFGLIIVASRDAGVALIFILIFLIMLWAGGVHWGWFVLAIGLAILVFPLVWNSNLIGSYQRERIMMIFDPSIDPDGTGIRWHTNQSLLSLTGGGVMGQGLFHGQRTQAGALSQQHTDFIFSVIGEELGIVGCTLVLLLLLAIVIRCIYVGVKSGNYMNRMICIGIAGMTACQIIINVGMCVGLTPVIGLTLPFISSGGSSIITMYMAMGIVSGIHMRPAPDANAHYVRPPNYSP